MSKPTKPIHVFFSPLSRRFYATSAYRDNGNGTVTVTGRQYDVTNDIANIIADHQVEFKERVIQSAGEVQEAGNE